MRRSALHSVSQSLISHAVLCGTSRYSHLGRLEPHRHACKWLGSGYPFALTGTAVLANTLRTATLTNLTKRERRHGKSRDAAHAPACFCARALASATLPGVFARSASKS